MVLSSITQGDWSTPETMTVIVAVVGAVLSALVAIWIYFESQREKDRNERREARHREVTSRISHLGEIIDTRHTALDAKFDMRMDSLSRRVDEQGEIMRTYGAKIDHVDGTVHAMDKRVAVLEAQHRVEDDAKRRDAGKATS